MVVDLTKKKKQYSSSQLLLFIVFTIIFTKKNREIRVFLIFQISNTEIYLIKMYFVQNVSD